MVLPSGGVSAVSHEAAGSAKLGLSCGSEEGKIDDEALVYSLEEGTFYGLSDDRSSRSPFRSVALRLCGKKEPRRPLVRGRAMERPISGIPPG